MIKKTIAPEFFFIFFFSIEKMRRNATALLVFLLLSGHSPIFSQSLHIQPLGVAQGLSQSSVLTIHQDSFGFIWMGTRDGLNEYNGNQITVYKNIIDDAESIEGNIINDIADAGDGNLWIAHNKGVSLFDRKNKKFKNYTLAGQENTGNPEIRSISIINSKVWASGWTGVYIFDSLKGKFTRPPVHDENHSVFVSSVSKIKAAPNGELWIATTTRGLFRYFPETDKAIRGIGEDNDQQHFERSIRIEDILFHPNGKVYLATYEHGIYECDINGKPLRHWWSGGESNENLRLDNVRQLMLDKSNQIWIGGFQGIGILNPKTGVAYMSQPFLNDVALETNSIRSLLLDRNGSVWIGTYHNGLMLYDPYLSRFKAINISNKTINYGIVSAFAQGNEGEIYIGTETGYILEYDQNHSLKNAYPVNDPNGGKVVIKTLLYTQGKVLIGTLRSGLFQLNDGNVSRLGISSPTSRNLKAISELGVVNFLMEESQGKIWIITDKGGGLNLYDPVKGEIEAFPASDAVQKLVGKGMGKHLVKFNEGYLLSTYGSGLIYFKKNEKGSAVRVAPEIKEVNHTNVKQGNIYVSTSGQGLFIINERFEITQRFSTKDGLLNNIVLSSIALPDDEVWINTFTGISHYSAKKGFRNYDKKNGYPLSEINAVGYKQGSGGHSISLLAGGKNAWVSFDPKRIYTNPYPPSVYITEIKISNQSITGLKGFEDIDLFRPQKLRLNHDQTTLNFKFTGLNYLMPQNNRYRYKMEGFEKDWRYTDYQGRAEYSYLPAGDYTFRLQAGNNDGVWTEKELLLPIKVFPPLWLSWQAFLVYTVIALGGIFLSRRIELRNAALKHDLQLKELERTRIDRESQLKTKHFTDISHEIRTPLTLILSPVEELFQEGKLNPKDRKRLDSIQYHGKGLLLLVNQLLDINRIEGKNEIAVPEVFLLKDFLEQLSVAFESMAAQLGIKWEVDTKGVLKLPVFLHQRYLEQVLLNLLSNSFKFTPAGGSIYLKAETRPGANNTCQLYLEVSDTGCGISREDLPHIFDRFFRSARNNPTGTGIGLSLVKTIVEDQLKGEIKVESSSQSGTTFFITIAGVGIGRDTKEVPAQPEFNIPAEFLPYKKQAKRKPNIIAGRESILIVEDNEPLLDFLNEKLEKYFNTVGVSTAEEGMDILKEKDFDLVVSDIMLPGINGMDFCTAIKSNIVTSHLPVILLTAIQNGSIKMKSFEQGADVYLTKPFVFEELYLRIRNLLNQRARLRQLYSQQGLMPEKSEIRYNKVDEELLQSVETNAEINLENWEYTIEQLGKDVGLSRVHLYRKLKKLTGYTPSQYMRNFRLKKAVEILSKEELRVSELAYRVGFQDQHYFMKCFKDMYGVAPSKYTQKH